MTSQPPQVYRGTSERPPRRALIVLISLFVIAVTALVTVRAVKSGSRPGAGQPAAAPGAIGTYAHHPVVVSLPAGPESYLGAFVKGFPGRYASVSGFNAADGNRTNLALYYSGWNERFKSAFAITAARHGVTPLIQIEPRRISFAAIVAGRYDRFLKEFATSVASFGASTGRGVIIGFGHEPNGYWYSWGYRHVRPALYKAAWRHVVRVFRQQGADNVTWLWTVNIIATSNHIPSPAPWWPGRAYVNWIGIDGYYLKPSWRFASLFGPTYRAVRKLTAVDPVLISETGALAGPGQPSDINDLFAGIRSYGMLGFVWFDARSAHDFRLAGPPAVRALRRGAATLTEAGHA